MWCPSYYNPDIPVAPSTGHVLTTLAELTEGLKGMIVNLNSGGISGQIDLFGTTINPVRLVWAGRSASLTRVCLSAGGPAYALNMAPLLTIKARDPRSSAQDLGPMVTSTMVAS